MATRPAEPVLARPMLQLLEVRDETGRILKDLRLFPDRLSDARVWRLEFAGPSYPDETVPTTVRSLDLTLAFPEERTFEFLVSSDPKAAPNQAASRGR